MATIDRITASDFAKILADGVNSRDESIDTRIGPVRDLFISPFAEVLEQQNNRVVYLSLLNSLENVNELVPDDVDKIVFNEGIVRWSGSQALTTVFFSRTQPPTSDITVPVNFPLSTEVDQKTGKIVYFRTIETKTMFAASPMAYYNASNGKYELEIAVASMTNVENTTIGPYSIKVFVRQIPGFDDVYNKVSAISGRPIETNKELANRYYLHIEGVQFGVPAGMKRAILDNFNSAEDAYVVYGESEYLTRDEYDTGAVDIWLLGSTPTTKEYIVSYPGVATLIPLDKQPLIDITTVSLTAGGTTYVQGTDFEVVSDVGINSRSNRGLDGIKFLVGGTLPNVGDSITITYRYNSLINVISAYFKQEENYVVGSDVLYRWAIQKDVELEASLRVKSGNPSGVLQSVRGVILDYINSLKLGDDVEEFDLDSVVSKIYGIDNFIYTTLAFKGGSGVSDLIVGPNEYARISEVDLIINLV